MGTEGTRRRNRNRRLRKKEQKLPKKGIRRNIFIIGALITIVTFFIVKVEIENICLYRSICMQMPLFGRILMHSSILEYEGKAYAFLGRSGTGKSTHTRLWRELFGDRAIMVNDDKPIIRLIDKIHKDYRFFL